MEVGEKGFRGRRPLVKASRPRGRVRKEHGALVLCGTEVLGIENERSIRDGQLAFKEQHERVLKRPRWVLLVGKRMRVVFECSYEVSIQGLVDQINCNKNR